MTVLTGGGLYHPVRLKGQSWCPMGAVMHVLPVVQAEGVLKKVNDLQLFKVKRERLHVFSGGLKFVAVEVLSTWQSEYYMWLLLPFPQLSPFLPIRMDSSSHYMFIYLF